jgi:CRISPR system Cascade subunit CasD
MTRTLLLRFDGPMQSWGVAAFGDRPTLPFPTKSGIVGLLANAHGRGRDDEIEDLASLVTAVRADDLGQPMIDFQTAGRDGWRSADGRLHTDTTKIRRKGYLTDAVFTAALTGPSELVERTAAAVARPARPLFLGRRCCPPAASVLIGISTLPTVAALAALPYQGHLPVPPARFIVAADDTEGEVWDDVPMSFAVGNRMYGSRWVKVIEVVGRDHSPAEPTDPADSKDQGHRSAGNGNPITMPGSLLYASGSSR